MKSFRELTLRLTRQRRLAGLLAASAILSGLGVISATPALGLGKGTGCMFYAPTGADNFGHVGWGFSVGSANQWIFGATEFGDGANSSSWSLTGTQATMMADFRNTLSANGRLMHNAGYYTEWRCLTINNSAVTAAKDKAAQDATNGYTLLFNDCLTKSMDILSAYGESLSSRALYVTPANYFVSGLNSSDFGPIHQL
jgi:hypothetical protein